MRLAMRENAVAQRRAVNVLEKLIEELTAQGKERLPSLRELSDRAGVAYVSMCKAVRSLVARGRLSTRRGAGTFVNLSPPAHQPAPSPAHAPRGEQRWEAACGALRRDILRGIYRPGEALPARKELTRSRGISHRTLRKVLTRLEHERVIEHHQRGYRVPSLRPTTGRGTLVVVARGIADLRRLSPRAQEYFRILQSECSKARIALRIVFHEYTTRGLTLVDKSDWHLLTNPRRASVVGYMVFTRGLTHPAPNEVASRLTRFGLPVAVLDETGERPLPGKQGRALRVFSISNSSECGGIAGRYLLSLGHRRVAYIGAAQNNAWSRNRLAGLCDTYGEAGDDTAVRAVTLDQVRMPSRPRDLHADVGKALARLVTAGTRRAGDFRSMVGHTLSRSSWRIANDVRREVMRSQIRPLFEQALRCSETTAWVAANDEVGVEALSFLREHGRRVPRDISVIGFDDSLEAFLAELTSYNHNEHAVLHAMLDYVLDPRRNRALSAQRSSPVEIEGFVNERGSTGPASRV